MSTGTFALEDGVSYSAGVAYIVKKKGGSPTLLLILQKPGEKNEQRAGGVFMEKRVWKMPMGHFDAAIDKTIIDAAAREFEEETGFVIDKELLSLQQSVSIRIPSERPGAEFHEDVFFLVMADREPNEQSRNERDERTETVSFFPLTKLPVGTEKDSYGAPTAHGHRKKLARLLLRCASFVERYDINVHETLTAIANARG